MKIKSSMLLGAMLYLGSLSASVTGDLSRDEATTLYNILHKSVNSFNDSFSDYNGENVSNLFRHGSFSLTDIANISDELNKTLSKLDPGANNMTVGDVLNDLKRKVYLFGGNLQVGYESGGYINQTSPEHTLHNTNQFILRFASLTESLDHEFGLNAVIGAISQSYKPVVSPPPPPPSLTRRSIVANLFHQ